MMLTGRQRQFLRGFLGLYRDAAQPLHYTAVAEKLGVSPITAYDMLRLLEQRDLVIAEYVLPDQGRGRSTVVFTPAQKALDWESDTGMGRWEREEWAIAKERILGVLREARGTDYQEVLDGLLRRIPELKSPALYVTEMLTAVLLHLHQLREDAMSSNVLESLRSLELPGQLAGLTVGLGYVEKANRHVTSLLLAYSRKYQEYLARLSTEIRQRLSDFAEEVVSIVEA